MADLDRALREWADLLGPAHVLSGESELRDAATATFATSARVLAVLRAGAREDVQGVLRIAGRCGIPVQPYSRGKNWGFGSRVPARDAAILDLSRMDRIVEVDQELGYAVVEPGVTQGQLHAKLAELGGALWIDPTSSTPDASVVGNALERGHGLTPYGDHVEHLSDLEVVLADGELLRTGFGGFAGSRAGAVDPWGVGPSIAGLFSQSPFGVVTRATVWLMHAPESVAGCFFGLDDDAALGAAIESMRPLRLSGLLRGGPRFSNRYRQLQTRMQYPWSETGGKTPLAPDVARRLAEPLGIHAWNAFLGFYGLREEVALQRREVERAVGGIARGFRVVEPGRGEPIDDPYDRRLFTLLSGNVLSVPTRPWWRKRRPAPKNGDPDRDRCGFAWVTAVLPLRAADARSAAGILERTILEHGFEPDVNLNNVRPRAVHAYASIVYDREVAGEDERAMRARDAAAEALVAAGYPPLRVPITWMSRLSELSGSARLIRALERALDPLGILAPGRYDGS